MLLKPDNDNMENQGNIEHDEIHTNKWINFFLYFTNEKGRKDLDDILFLKSLHDVESRVEAPFDDVSDRISDRDAPDMLSIQKNLSSNKKKLSSNKKENLLVLKQAIDKVDPWKRCAMDFSLLNPESLSDIKSEIQYYLLSSIDHYTDWDGISELEYEAFFSLKKEISEFNCIEAMPELLNSRLKDKNLKLLLNNYMVQSLVDLCKDEKFSIPDLKASNHIRKKYLDRCRIFYYLIKYKINQKSKEVNLYSGKIYQQMAGFGNKIDENLVSKVLQDLNIQDINKHLSAITETMTLPNQIMLKLEAESANITLFRLAVGSTMTLKELFKNRNKGIQYSVLDIFKKLFISIKAQMSNEALKTGEILNNMISGKEVSLKDILEIFRPNKSGNSLLPKKLEGKKGKIKPFMSQVVEKFPQLVKLKNKKNKEDLTEKLMQEFDALFSSYHSSSGSVNVQQRDEAVHRIVKILSNIDEVQFIH